MYPHEVTFTWQGHVRKETVMAHDSSDAKEIIKARYPGASVSIAVKK